MPNKPKNLWRCPKCDRQFANRHQSHSCGRYTVDAFLAGKSPQAVTLYKHFARMVQARGQVMLAPAKTRIGFQARMIFAAVDKLDDQGLEAHVVLSRRLESTRFSRIESLSPRNHVHHFQIRSTEDLDDEVRSWLEESYKVGMQEHLVKRRA